jgi:formylmethanofuran dehydrogenase subunit E
MWIALRAWWYLHIDKKKSLPTGVKDYVLRRASAMVDSLKDASPQEKLKFSEMEFIAAVTAEPGEISEELRGELIARSFNRLGKIPGETCSRCGRPVFAHEAVSVAEKFYCGSCASQVSGLITP